MLRLGNDDPMARNEALASLAILAPRKESREEGGASDRNWGAIGHGLASLDLVVDREPGNRPSPEETLTRPSG